MMIGSAIRKPRIHPGRGSDTADSMMDGRTNVMGTFPSHCSTRAFSPSAFVNG